MGSYLTRDQSHVSCIGSQILMAGLWDPSPGEGPRCRELSAVLLLVGPRGRVPRDSIGDRGLLRLLLG